MNYLTSIFELYPGYTHGFAVLVAVLISPFLQGFVGRAPLGWRFELGPQLLIFSLMRCALSVWIKCSRLV
jgi:hypothetical protein